MVPIFVDYLWIWQVHLLFILLFTGGLCNYVHLLLSLLSTACSPVVICVIYRWVWHNHMLAPQAYRQDLAATCLGRIMGHKIRDPTSPQVHGSVRVKGHKIREPTSPQVHGLVRVKGHKIREPTSPQVHG